MTVWKSVALSIFKISHPPTQLFAKNGYLDGVEYKNQIDIASFGGSSINSTIGGEILTNAVYILLVTLCLPQYPGCQKQQKSIIFSSKYPLILSYCQGNLSLYFTNIIISSRKRAYVQNLSPIFRLYSAYIPLIFRRYFAYPIKIVEEKTPFLIHWKYPIKRHMS